MQTRAQTRQAAEEALLTQPSTGMPAPPPSGGVPVTETSGHSTAENEQDSEQPSQLHIEEEAEGNDPTSSSKEPPEASRHDTDLLQPPSQEGPTTSVRWIIGESQSSLSSVPRSDEPAVPSASQAPVQAEPTQADTGPEQPSAGVNIFSLPQQTGEIGGSIGRSGSYRSPVFLSSSSSPSPIDAQSPFDVPIPLVPNNMESRPFLFDHGSEPYTNPLSDYLPDTSFFSGQVYFTRDNLTMEEQPTLEDVEHRDVSSIWLRATYPRQEYNGQESYRMTNTWDLLFALEPHGIMQIELIFHGSGRIVLFRTYHDRLPRGIEIPYCHTVGAMITGRRPTSRELYSMIARHALDRYTMDIHLNAGRFWLQVFIGMLLYYRLILGDSARDISLHLEYVWTVNEKVLHPIFQTRAADRAGRFQYDERFNPYA